MSKTESEVERLARLEVRRIVGEYGTDVMLFIAGFRAGLQSEAVAKLVEALEEIRAGYEENPGPHSEKRALEALAEFHTSQAEEGK